MGPEKCQRGGSDGVPVVAPSVPADPAGAATFVVRTGKFDCTALTGRRIPLRSTAGRHQGVATHPRPRLNKSAAVERNFIARQAHRQYRLTIHLLDMELRAGAANFDGASTDSTHGCTANARASRAVKFVVEQMHALGELREISYFAQELGAGHTFRWYAVDLAHGDRVSIADVRGGACRSAQANHAE